jgi:hypothetical protein
MLEIVFKYSKWIARSRERESRYKPVIKFQ